jgi:hypothetical protein
MNSRLLVLLLDTSNIQHRASEFSIRRGDICYTICIKTKSDGDGTPSGKEWRNHFARPLTSSADSVPIKLT